LRGYENEMTLVSQQMSSDLQMINRAADAGEITREEAEYLIQERYQVAMMRYQVFTALHDALREDMQRADGKSARSPASSSVTTSTGPAIRPTEARGQ
jgi:hypothetical protein